MAQNFPTEKNRPLNPRWWGRVELGHNRPFFVESKINLKKTCGLPKLLPALFHHEFKGLHLLYRGFQIPVVFFKAFDNPFQRNILLRCLFVLRLETD